MPINPLSHTFARTLATVLVAGLAFTTLGQQQHQDYSKVEIKETPISGNIHVLLGAGGNIGVSAGPDGLLIVDDEFLPLAEKIDAALGKLTVPPPAVVNIFQTPQSLDVLTV